jgi:diaminohydroxyphosphoribosylaminopyrimidine deaminase/5-amino-6-(5-phosphoribosylamino)uracil reductase
MEQATHIRRAFDRAVMRRALDLARRGLGRVEPNPAVGAVVTAGERIVGEGWHERFGGPHAEVGALAAAGDLARGGTLYVTLEPCCHHGKTPPCTDAIIAAGIARVVAAAGDPHPAVAGGGIARLRAAGVEVETGLLEAEARRITAPFRKRIATGRPWVIAKWATSLDGRLAGPPGADRWISSPESRALVHALRERVDAIVVGIGTVLADDPLLTARPDDPAAGHAVGMGPRRQPLRVVLDRQARLPVASRLVRTARDVPLLVATGPDAPQQRVAALRGAGCDIWAADAADAAAGLDALFEELGDRGLTNVLVEGGAEVLRTLFATRAADEAWVFVAPAVLGGDAEVLPTLADAPPLVVEEVMHPGGDILVRGRFLTADWTD